MVAHGTPCLGPVTQAGCGALCPSFARGCYGCFGPMETPNTAALSARWLELGAGKDDLVRAFRAFTAGAEPFRKEAAIHDTARPTTRIKVPVLARVEGEGGLEIVTEHGQVTEARLDIYEPPRFFEGLLRGRRYTEPPDITARICGICPVAYQMSACLAIEDACGVTVPEPVTALRRLLYCGEWIESHALHIYLLHAPDFLGYESGIHLARDHPEILQRGLRHEEGGQPADGGGRRALGAPGQRPGRRLLPRPGPARPAARWPANSSGPGRRRWTPLPGWRRSTSPTSAATTSTSRCSTPTGTRSWATGSSQAAAWTSRPATTTSTSPSTRCRTPRRCTRCSTASAPTWSGRWPGTACTPGGCPRRRRPAARAAGLGATCDNPFRSIIVRAVELVYACEEALRLIGSYEPPDPPYVDVPPAAATGYGCTEAPRGMLYHRYRITARRHDRRREDRPADLAEPAGHRGRPARVRRAAARPAARRS